MFTNKHVVIAFIVAPILAILAWFAVGHLVGEQPHAARPGESYPLLEKSNCRYDSGACDLQNEDFKLVLSLTNDAAGPVLRVDASHPLDALLLGISDSGGGAVPVPVRAGAEGGRQWRLALAEVPSAEQRIRLVASAGGVRYFAESGTAFLERYRGD